MAEINEYKCACCGGKLEFNSTVQKMKCPFCESEFEIQAVQDYNNSISQSSGDQMNWETQAGGEWQSSELNGMNVYSCQSCGGQIIADHTTGASKCPYCDNPVVMSGTFSDDKRPDSIIPFKVDKEAAKAALIVHMSGKKLLPSVFKEQNHIDEIKGIYVPVWLFDAEADADMVFKCDKTRSWQDDQFAYVEHNMYSAYRSGKLAFKNVPVDGSEKMDDTLMESIEPFDYSQAVEFKTAYLSGYLADRYDVSAEESINRANTRIKRSTEQTFASTVNGYNSVNCEHSSVRLRNGKAKYSLYPVWLLNTSWNGQKYTFAMNGQTGKFVGDLPVDKSAAIKHSMITFIIAFIVTIGVLFLFTNKITGGSIITGLVVGAIITMIVVGSLKAQLKSVHSKQTAADYKINESLHLSDNRDIFLYKKLDKTPIIRNNNGNGGAPPSQNNRPQAGPPVRPQFRK